MAEQGRTSAPLAQPATSPPELSAYLARLEQTADSAAAAAGGFHDAFFSLAG
ncbi:MAG: hypothetical protein QOI19_491, partial [Thermoleophilaceae bacterium]|nr:hypothetical protein [Thermoleophilaceae bacterium]